MTLIEDIQEVYIRENLQQFTNPENSLQDIKERLVVALLGKNIDFFSW